MTEQGTAVDWDGLLVRLLHETQLRIIEALRWIDQPLSATQLIQVLDESMTVPSFSYHIRRLKKLGVLKLARTRDVRGVRERFYRLTPADK